MADWQNRIVGTGEVDPHELTPNPLNWRRHPSTQQAAVHEALERLGWVQQVIVNRRTGRLIDGHLRVELARERGERVPVLYVDLDEDEERLALATLDPLAALAEPDDEVLAQLLEGVQLEDGPLAEVISTLAGEELEAVHDPDPEYYTGKLDGLIYEPQESEPPPVAELYDTSKTSELEDAIMEADLPDDVRAFLMLAARRFTAFRYDRIAEYYAHASPEVQELMERLALVIVDYDQAIELGFARLSDALAEEYERVMGDA